MRCNESFLRLALFVVGSTHAFAQLIRREVLRQDSTTAKSIDQGADLDSDIHVAEAKKPEAFLQQESDALTGTLERSPRSPPLYKRGETDWTALMKRQKRNFTPGPLFFEMENWQSVHKEMQSATSHQIFQVLPNHTRSGNLSSSAMIEGTANRDPSNTSADQDTLDSSPVETNTSADQDALDSSRVETPSEAAEGEPASAVECWISVDAATPDKQDFSLEDLAGRLISCMKPEDMVEHQGSAAGQDAEGALATGGFLTSLHVSQSSFNISYGCCRMAGGSTNRHCTEGETTSNTLNLGIDEDRILASSFAHMKVECPAGQMLVSMVLEMTAEPSNYSLAADEVKTMFANDTGGDPITKSIGDSTVTFDVSGWGSEELEIHMRGLAAGEPCKYRIYTAAGSSETETSKVRVNGVEFEIQGGEEEDLALEGVSWCGSTHGDILFSFEGSLAIGGINVEQASAVYAKWKFKCCGILDSTKFELGSECNPGSTTARDIDETNNGVNSWMPGEAVRCPYSTGMVAWTFEWDEATHPGLYRNVYECCMIEDVITLGQPKKACEWIGDPHFTTFDNAKLDMTEGSDGVYWIVKSDLLEIQGYYQGDNETANNMNVRGIVVGGPMLLDHKVIIRKDTGWFGDDKVPEWGTEEKGNVIEWISKKDDGTLDSEVIPTTSGVTYTRQINDKESVEITYSGGDVLGRTKLFLPHGIDVEVDGREFSQDNFLKMGFIEGMDGQCGNMNAPEGGADSDDTAARLEENPIWQVGDDEDMFHNQGLFAVSRGPEGIRHALFSAGAEECFDGGALEQQHRDECQAVFGGTVMETFMRICIADRCLAPNSPEMAIGDMDAADHDAAAELWDLGGETAAFQPDDSAENASFDSAENASFLHEAEIVPLPAPAGFSIPAELASADGILVQQMTASTYADPTCPAGRDFFSSTGFGAMCSDSGGYRLRDAAICAGGVLGMTTGPYGTRGGNVPCPSGDGTWPSEGCFSWSGVLYYSHCALDGSGNGGNTADSSKPGTTSGDHAGVCFRCQAQYHVAIDNACCKKVNFEYRNQGEDLDIQECANKVLNDVQCSSTFWQYPGTTSAALRCYCMSAGRMSDGYMLNQRREEGAYECTVEEITNGNEGAIYKVEGKDERSPRKPWEAVEIEVVQRQARYCKNEGIDLGPQPSDEKCAEAVYDNFDCSNRFWIKEGECKCLAYGETRGLVAGRDVCKIYATREESKILDIKGKAAITEQAISAAESCEDGLVPARIRSATEQRQYEQALAEMDNSAAGILRIGASCDNIAWRWADNTLVCGFTNFDIGEDRCKGAGHKDLCIITDSGKWSACTGSPLTLCMEEKMYAPVLETKTSIAARLGCGEPFLQLAMPKSAAETTKLIETWQDDELYFIGGSYNEGKARWEWDDGTEICGYTNWYQPGPPGMSEDTANYLCINADTGKWYACAGDETERAAFCETRPPSRECPESVVPIEDLNLNVAPTSSTALFREHCFYLGMAGESCTETCSKVLDNAFCDSKGLMKASHSVHSCATTLATFGGLEWTQQQSSSSSRSGCNYVQGQSSEMVSTEMQEMTMDSPIPSPQCDAETGTSAHRICACEPLHSQRDRLSDHVVLEGERLRMVFHYSGHSTCSFEFRCGSHHNVAVKFQFNPPGTENGGAGGSIWLSRKGPQPTGWSDDVVVMLWPFDLSGGLPDLWKFELKSTRDRWVTYIDGKKYDELSYPKVEGLDGITTSYALGCTIQQYPQLIRAEDGAPGFPVSMNSANNCIEHRAAEEYGVEHEYWTIRIERLLLTDTTSNRCLRCEALPFEEGNNLEFQAGRLAFLTPSNTPEQVQFAFQFDPNVVYENVQVVYAGNDKFVDLYVNSQLEDRLMYEFSHPLDIGPGYIGCHDGSLRVLMGYVIGFQMFNELPDNMPMLGDCRGFLCPEGMSLLPTPTARFCGEMECDSSNDQDINVCCGILPMCDPTFTCPEGEVYQYGADEIRCTFLDCENQEPHHCCANKGSCLLYTCIGHTILKPDASDIYCETPQCQVTENSLCCDDIALCETYPCPESYVERLNTEELLYCAARSCDAVDRDSCCARVGTCASYNCSHYNKVHKANADKHLCALETCDSTSSETCCADRQSCLAYRCPTGYIDKVDSIVLQCAEESCLQSMNNTELCCDILETCASYECPIGSYFLKSNPGTTYCEDRQCTAIDLHTCCSRRGFCDSYPCPVGSEHRDGAHDIQCFDGDCTEDSYTTCCAIDGTCDNYDCPPETYVLRNNSHDILCQHPHCSGLDTSVCCEQKASCAVHECPPGTRKKFGANNLFCEEAICGPQDDDTCCGTPGRCNLFECPPGYLTKADAEDIPCPDFDCLTATFDLCCAREGTCRSHTCPDWAVHKAEWLNGGNVSCAGWTCTETDNERCCSPRASCRDLNPPIGFTLRTDAMAFLCKDTTCTTEDDTHTCAYQEGTCASFMQCPEGEGLRPDAHEILCADQQCGDTDVWLCCGDLSQCVFYTCPSGFQLRLNAGNLTCDGFKCDMQDRDICCEPQQMCSHFVPPQGYVLRPDYTTIKCLGLTCNSETDLNICAAPEGMCSGYGHCGDGYSLRHDADEILCEDQTCEETDPHTCCAPDGHCDSFTCDGLWTHANNNMTCVYDFCTEVDRPRCCTMRATCLGLSNCPAELGYIRIPDPANAYCKTDVCEEAPVLDTPGWTNGLGLDCQYYSEMGWCSNGGFPSGMEWAGKEGTDHAQRFNHPGLNCVVCGKGAAQGEDIDTCCMRTRKCEAYTACPKDTVLRNDASDIWCTANSCFDTDWHVCCVAQDSCESFTCPEYMVLRWDAAERTCAAWKCSDRDVYQCCVHRARCKDFACGEGWTRWEPAAKLQCANATCTEEDDKELCCRKDGRCSAYKCAEGTALRYDAADILCRDDQCSNEDNAKCCADLASCLTYECSNNSRPIPPFEDDPEGGELFAYRGFSRSDRHAAQIAAISVGTARTETCPDGGLFAHDRCWYLGEQGRSCRTTCAAQGLAYSLAAPPADPMIPQLLGRAPTMNQAWGRIECYRQDGDRFHPAQHTPDTSTHDLDHDPGDWYYEGCSLACSCSLEEEYEPLREICGSDCPGACVTGTQCFDNGWSDRCVAIQESDFVFGLSGTSSCPEGSVMITNDTTCRAFYLSHASEGVKWGQPDPGDTAHPPGCFFNANDPAVGFKSELNVPGSSPCITPICLRTEVSHKKYLYCSGWKCTERDEPTCCQARSTCAGYACDTGYILKPGAAELRCWGIECGPRDLNTCCHVVGLCSAATCLDGFVLRNESASIFCESNTCTDQDYSICCVPQGHCSQFETGNDFYPNLTCPSGYTFKNGTENLCQLEHCAPSDADMCCDENAFCVEYVPEPGWVLKANATFKKCHSAVCTAHDRDTCSEPEGLCTSVSCGPGMALRMDASERLCSTVDCLNMDESFCCAPDGKCVTHDCGTQFRHKTDALTRDCVGNCSDVTNRDICCDLRESCIGLEGSVPAKYAMRGNADKLRCANRTCELAVDRDTCMVLSGRCSMMYCGDGMLLRHDADDLLCSDAECSHTPVTLCCVEEGKCDSWPCPEGFVHKAHSWSLDCVFQNCTEDVDRDMCCDPVPVCSSYDPVEEGYALRANADHIYCHNVTCGPQDLEQCADLEGRCSTYECDFPEVLRGDAESRLCSTATCISTEDDSTCCAVRHSCGGFEFCPEGWLLRLDVDDETCDSFACQPHEYQLCCEQRPTCIDYVHEGGWINIPLPHTVYCIGRHCGPEDKDRCSVVPGSCTQLTCPEGHTLRHDAMDILCSDFDCTREDVTRCCAELGSCATFECDADWVHKPDPENRKCTHGWTCVNPLDTPECCNRKAYCTELGEDSYPADYVPRGDAASIFCAGAQCDINWDLDTCGTKAGRCAAYTCLTDSAKLVSDADELRCLDESCSPVNELRCCASTGRCSRLDCGPGWGLWPGREEQSCASFECVRDIDRPTCCKRRQVCSEWTCDEVGYTHRGNAYELYCEEEACSVKDLYTCCAPVNVCASYSCTAPYVLRHDADQILCDDVSCQHDDMHRCCAPVGRCDSMPCPENYVHKPDPHELYCGGGVSAHWHCEEDDRDYCCNMRQSCEEFIHLVPTGSALKALAPVLRCASFPCTLEDDLETCADDEGKCTTMFCEDGYAHRWDASDRYCNDKDCLADDFHWCCAEDKSCLTYMCPSGHTLIPDANTTHCLGFECSDHDRDTCCVMNTRCTEYRWLPLGYALRADHNSLFCKTATCTQKNDLDTCADLVGRCTTFSCPYQYFLRQDATDRLCTDDTCTRTDNVWTCCAPMRSCSTYQCPSGYRHIPEANNTDCQSLRCGDHDRDLCCARLERCTQHRPCNDHALRAISDDLFCADISCVHCDGVDKDTCSVPEGMCPEMTCPTDYVLRLDADDIIRCDTDPCISEDYNRCCVHTSLCNSFQCPEGMPQVANANHTSCYGVKCSEADIATCCQTRAFCNTLDPPRGWGLVPEAASIQCREHPCDVQWDLETCAQRLGHCDMMQCSEPDYLLRVDALEIMCTDINCTSKSDNDLCCALNGMCLTFTCPSGYVHNSAASITTCLHSTCTLQDDRDTCCNEESSCYSHTCPDALLHRLDANLIKCANYTCKSPDDDQTCCAPKNSCSLYECTSDYVHKGDADNHMCERADCLGDNNEVCCVENGKCDSYTCPSEYVYRETYPTIHCLEEECTDADRDVCCLPRQRCNFMTEREGWARKGLAAELLCKTEACTWHDDKDQCMSQMGTCDTMTCPWRYQLKTDINTAETYCDDPECETNFLKCCAEAGLCSTYSCPSGYVLDAMASNLSCAKWTCDAQDTEKCCVHQAPCSTFDPEFYNATGYVLKLANDSLWCAGEKCTAEDRDTCAEMEGRCSRMTCPDHDYILRRDAADVICTDRDCGHDTDFLLCCISAGTCASHLCEGALVERPNTQNVSCRGLSCTSVDDEQCCIHRAWCSSLVLPNDDWTHKPDAHEILCENSTCTEEADLHTCLDGVGACTQFRCGPGFELKEDASDLKCSDRNCTDTDKTHCCDKLGECSSYTCPSGYVPDMAARNESCTHWRCEEQTDRDICCDPLAMCNSHPGCPANHVLKLNSELIPCHKKTCDAADNDVCCDHEGSCAQVTCPDSKTKRADSEDILCADKDCIDSDIDLCCVDLGHCLSYTCPEFYVHKPDDSDLRCKKWTCSPVAASEDTASCCEPVARCNTMQGCPATHSQKPLAADIPCQSSACTEGTDEEACCAEDGYCTSMLCPDFYIHRQNADDIMCDDPGCDDTTDYNTCCAQTGICDSFHCPSGYVLKPDASDIQCADSLCDPVHERDVCCEETAFCSSLAHCPVHKTHLPGSAAIRCAGAVCNEWDSDICCGKEGTCLFFTCPEDTLHRWNASSIYCGDEDCKEDTGWRDCCVSTGVCSSYQCPEGYLNRAMEGQIDCLGWTCNEGDRDICCQPVARCSEMICPENFVLSPRKEYLFCEGPECGTIHDRAECCDEEGTCSSYDCPEEWIHKQNSGEIRCEDRDCSGTPVETCCGHVGMCNSFACPSGYVLREDAATIACKDWQCTVQADRDYCCDVKARCNEMPDGCPTTKTLAHNGFQRFCEGRYCGTDNDVAECCASLGQCDSYRCPPAMLHRLEASEISCATETCDIGPHEVCCAETGTCETYRCPDFYVKKPNVSERNCMGWFCGDVDRDNCCLPIGRCNSLELPREYVHKLSAAAILCADVKCTQEADLERCANLRGQCFQFECPPQMLPRIDADSKLCSDVLCEASGFHGCCSEEGGCTLLDCGHGYEHTHTAWNLSCAGIECDINIDRDTCCWEVSLCVEHTCPVNNSHHGMADSRFCAHHECGLDKAHDDEQCCVVNGYCIDYSCPDGYIQKVDAATRHCSDENCTGSDYHWCCTQAAFCSSLNCATITHGEGILATAGYYLPKPFAANESCKGLTCTEDDDLDTCCQLRESCTQYMCPHPGYQPHQHNEVRRCAGLECELTDLLHCCAEDGMCPIMRCPQDYTLKKLAHEIACEDPFCNQTDVNVCCDENGQCPSLECKPGYTMVHNGSLIYCNLPECTLEFDHSRCCEPLARCSEHVCPDRDVHKAHADELSCHSRVCIEGIDDSECCAHKGHCLTFHCPRFYQWRHDVEDLVCYDESCERGLEACCSPDGHCLAWTCLSGWVPKPTARQLFCKGAQCTEEDNPGCCDERQLCDRYECSPGYSHRPDVSAIMCANSTCTLEDLRTCCTRDGYCDSMICPEGHVTRPNAHDIMCGDPSCNNSAFFTCCAPQGICTSLHCPSGWVHDLNASMLACRTDICTDADISECCEPREPCADFTGPEACASHEDEFVLLSNANQVLCETTNCNPDDDFDTCCVPGGTCATYTCTNGTILVADADMHYCKDPICSTARDEDCCDSQSSCSTYQCPSGWQLKFEPERITCPFLRCTDNDKWRCCQQRAMCDTMVCPYDYMLRHNPQFIMCKNSTCNIYDRDTCCSHNDYCPSYRCPDGWAHRSHAEDITCDKGLDGEISCNETHPTRCCDVEGRCSTFKCPETYVLRADPETIPCKGEVCDVDHDEERCCKKVSYCNSYDCTIRQGRVQKATAAKIPCENDECTDNACCSDAGKCITMPCPAGEAHKLHAEDLWCSDGECEATDYELCCDSLSKCSTYACPSGWRTKANNDSLSCDGWKCVDRDTPTCCDKLAECVTWKCEGVGSIQNSARLLDYCNDTICTAEDEEYCCMEGYLCSAGQCPVNWVHLEDASNIICQGVNCTDSNFTLCCEEKAMCNTYTCPFDQGYVETYPPTDNHCSDSECTSLDNEICCRARELCKEYACQASGYALIQDDSLMCQNYTCTEKDDKTCCEQRAKCSMHSCPQGMQWKEGSAKILCEFGKCISSGDKNQPSYDDLHCCETFGSCGGSDYQCPDGYAFKDGHEDIPCYGRFCSDEHDKFICCDPSAPCSKYDCEKHEGWIHRKDRTLKCQGKECQSEDMLHCCQEEGAEEESEGGAHAGDEEDEDHEDDNTEEEESTTFEPFATTTTVGVQEDEEQDLEAYACRVHGLAIPMATMVRASILTLLLQNVATALSAVAQ